MFLASLRIFKRNGSVTFGEWLIGNGLSERGGECWKERCVTDLQKTTQNDACCLLGFVSRNSSVNAVSRVCVCVCVSVSTTGHSSNRHRCMS